MDGQMASKIRCKRIIDGKTYNTETATRVAGCSNMDVPFPPAFEIAEVLYQTRHGAYFRYYYDERVDEWESAFEGIKPLTPEEARIWMEKNANTELIEKHFGEMPEAGEGESRVTFRMPDSLKRKIDAAAAASKQSTNAWLVRCVERCVGEQG